MLTSHDGGLTWTNRPSDFPETFYSVAFDASTARAIVVGDDGAVLYSDDNGATWTERNSGVSRGLLSVAFDASTGRAIAVGRGGIILTSDDNGATWTERDSGSELWLMSVAFNASTARAIAVGDEGIVLYSDNNGATWTERASRVSDVHDSVALNARTGRAIAVGLGGAVFTSDDYGTTWTERDSGISDWLNSVVLDANSGHAVAVANTGAVLSSRDFGDTWTVRATGSKARLSSVALDASAGRAVAVGDEGIVLTSGDAGATWIERTSGFVGWLHSVAFDAGTGRAIAVGNEGAVLSSNDGGETWTERESDTSAWLSSVAFDASTGRAIAVGNGGVVLISDDSGATWTKASSDSTNGLYSVAFDAGTGRAIAVGNEGIVLISDDSGATWTKAPSASTNELYSVAFDAGTGRAIAVGNESTVLISNDYRATWTARASGNSPPLASVAFDASTGRAIAVGNAGAVLSSNDGGWTWTERASGISAWLSSVAFDASTGRAIAVGTDGVVLTSDDAGETWSIVVFHGRIYPAPIGLLGLLLSLGSLTLLRYQRDRGPTESASETVEPGTKDLNVSDKSDGSGESSGEGSRRRVIDLLVSDRPLRPGEPDLLGFDHYVQGLSGLLRNPGTGFPITVAATAQWGAGKSSFMRLLETDLRGQGYLPAWFNAWHDQNEDNVLSSLLLAIRSQAVPRIFSHKFFPAIGLRVSLLRSRWKTVVLFVAVPVLVVLVVPSAWLDFAGELWQWLTALASGAIGVAKGSSSFGLNLRRGLVGFTGATAHLVDPAGRHERLRRDFRDVSRSIGRQLVIFIDDLDRCQPAKVVETLEAVNFLVTAGECAVVLGMDYQRVAHCVGLARKELAQAEHGAATGEEPETDPRMAYAHQYLQKLINVELPITPDLERVKKLLATSEKSLGEAETSDRFPRVWSRLWRSRVAGLLAAVSLAVLLVAPYVYDVLMPETPVRVVTPVPGPVKEPGPPGPQPPTRGGGGVQPPSPQPVAEPAPTREPVPKTTLEVVYWPVIAGLLLLLILGLLLVFRRLNEDGWVKLRSAVDASLHRLSARPEEARDTEDFKVALDIWTDVVVHHEPTPRAFKRFLNRLRFLAALLQAENGGSLGWKREVNLVALAALHHVDVDYLEPSLFRPDGLHVTAHPARSQEDLHRLREAGRKHTSPGSWSRPLSGQFESPWPPEEEEIEQFRKLSAGVHV